MITVNQEGKLLRWYDDVGALFDAGEIIADVQTAAGIVRVVAPYSGRLTEMQVLVGEDVRAGETIGWLDKIAEPALLGSLIDAPAERKLKSAGPKRKPRFGMTSMARVVLLVFMMTSVIAVFMVVFLIAPVRVVEVLPTPQFQIQERVLLRGQVGEHNWGEQGIVQDIGYDAASGTWYEVLFGDELLRLNEAQLEDLASIAPTPTMRFDRPGQNWSSAPMVLKEKIADFPAGTRVMIGSAMFNGVEWELNVTVMGTTKALTVSESQLEYAAP